LPTAFSLDSSSGVEKVMVLENNPTTIGSYLLRVLLTDPTTGVTSNIDFVTVIKCTKAITLVSNPIPSIAYNVGNEVLQAAFMDLPVYEPSPSTCPIGTYTYQLEYLGSGSFPAFTSQYPTSRIAVQTQSTTNLGMNHFKVIATESISGLQNNQATKDIDLFCQVTSLTFILGDF
jgi:hypothetical protein